MLNECQAANILSRLRTLELAKEQAEALAARATQNATEEQSRRMRLEQDLALRTWERDQAKADAETWQAMFYELRGDRDHALAHVAVNEHDGIALHTRPDSMPGIGSCALSRQGPGIRTRCRDGREPAARPGREDPRPAPGDAVAPTKGVTP